MELTELQIEKRRTASRVMNLYGMMVAYQTLKTPQYHTAIDVGSYNGLHSRVYSKLFKRVISFDPSDHKDINILQSPNQEFHKKALYSEKKSIDFISFPIGGFDTLDEKESRRKIREGYKFNTKKIQTYTLDEFNISDVNFIKIDAEGSDGHIIMGAKETILKYRPVIQVENLGERNDAHDFLMLNDYTVFDGSYLFDVYNPFRDNLYVPKEKI